MGKVACKIVNGALEMSMYIDAVSFFFCKPACKVKHFIEFDVKSRDWQYGQNLQSHDISYGNNFMSW